MYWLGGCLFICIWIFAFGWHYYLRCSEAERITRYWLDQNGYVPPPPDAIRANAWRWPVQVAVDVVDGSGKPVRLNLRVGGALGGVFSGQVECASIEPLPMA